MKHYLFYFAVIVFLAVPVLGQKGIDKQTKEIEDGAKTEESGGKSSKIFSWGKDKTKIRKRLDNPYKIKSRRDILINIIASILVENRLIVDEETSQFDEGLIITQPYIFAKGVILTRNELNRYAVIPESKVSWTRARYSLTIDVQSLDGIENNVSVTAKVEGRTGNGLFSEWTNLQSSGEAEDVFLETLVSNLTGNIDDTERKP